MKEITLKFTEKQFQVLRNLVYWGKWMVESRHDYSYDKFMIEEEVEQIIYSATKEKGICELNADDNIYFPTSEYEEKMQLIIDDYDEYTFWEELAYRLADRDTKIEVGGKFETLTPIEFFEYHHKYLEFYSDEFMNNELDNLKIVQA